MVVSNNGPKYGNRIYDSNGVDVKADTMTSVWNTISYEHHEIHNGSHYYHTHWELLTTAATYILGITTPNTSKHAHIFTNVQGTGDTTIQAFEGSAYSGGSAVIPRNNNRNFPDSSTLVLVEDPSITTTGTMIDNCRVGLAGNFFSGSSGGSNIRENELVLKQNESYMIRVTSNSASNTVCLIAEWYEHTTPW